MDVVKRDGRVVPFDKKRIVYAISKAGFVPDDVKQKIAQEIEKLERKTISVEEIQDLVEKKLMATSYKGVAREYVRYRYKRELIREKDKLNNSILEILDTCNEHANEENSNKNATLLSTQRDYMAGETSKFIMENLLLPDYLWKAHKDGLIHIHDTDYIAAHIFNCCLVNLEDMLQNGTVISKTLIEKPHSFATACNIATQIIAQVASNQYGGNTITLSHLAPFVDISRKKIRDEVLAEFHDMIVNREIEKKPDDDVIDRLVENRLKKEIKRGVQTIQYQINTLMTTNGQTPFVSVCMYLNEVPEGQIRDDLAMVIEEVLTQRMEGVKNEKGVWITPAFPKLLYVLEENNVHEDSKYFYLTELAAKCSAKRLVPDYISEKVMKQNKVDTNGDGQCYPCMGCRSFLTPYIDDEGKPKYYGRFNQGVVTINLVDVALTVLAGDTNVPEKEFWAVLEERLELCHKALQIRHQRLVGTPSDVSPVHFQYGAIARLKKGEPIDKLLFGGYSTISLGYAGLYECVKAMTGKSHTDEEAKPFAIAIMKKLNEKCAEWKKEENIDYSVYGTPLESTTGKFATCLQKRFGKIEGITDHGYITNSYHVNVREHIDAFTKLKFESEFQKLSPGGCISYIETSNLDRNIPAVLEVIKYIYDNIMYAELNTKSDYCQVCGFDGEIQVYENENGKLGWKCPNCGNTDQSKMNVVRRTCGYLGANFWAAGRTEEIRDRFVHLDIQGE